MKKIKQVFPSRNYITIDSYGDVEVVFNPVGDGFEGDDKLMFRKGRWAFRVNDFLSGKVMADGSKEGMGRKVYSLNLVYDDKDGEPIVNTTYVDPTSVIPLDGSVVDVVGLEKLAQEETLKTLAKQSTLSLIEIHTGALAQIETDVGLIYNKLLHSVDKNDKKKVEKGGVNFDNEYAFFGSASVIDLSVGEEWDFIVVNSDCLAMRSIQSSGVPCFVLVGDLIGYKKSGDVFSVEKLDNFVLKPSNLSKIYFVK